MLLGFPTEVWIIMAVEFAERLGYYGITFMLMTYCTNMLRWSPSVGNAIINSLYALTPVSACISAGLSDGSWGRPFSLIIALCVYAIGLTLVAISSFPFMYINFPLEVTELSIVIFAVGMLLFAIGYGAMKVCTNPLMADNISEYYKDNERECQRILSRLFRWVYAVTNSGSLIGIIVPPLLRDLDNRRVIIGSITYTTGYYYGFAMSAISCMIGLMFFAIMYHRYHRNQEVPSFVLARIIFRAIRIRWYFVIGRIDDDLFLKAHRWDLIDFANYSKSIVKDSDLTNTSDVIRMGTSDLSETLYKSKGTISKLREEEEEEEEEEENNNNVPNSFGVSKSNDNDVTSNNNNNNNNSNIIYSDFIMEDNNIIDFNPNLVNDAKKVIFVCRAFVAMPIYWLITNQFSTNLILQASAMKLPEKIPPEIFNNVNVVALLISLVLFDRVIFPLMFHDQPPPMRGRVVSGFTIMIISMIWCAFIQVEINKRGFYNNESHYNVNPEMNMLPAGWLITPYIMQGIASALVDTTVMEVAYIEAPTSMKGAVMALYLIASSISGFLGLALSPVMKPQNALIIILSLAAALFVVTIIFYILNGSSRRVSIIAPPITTTTSSSGNGENNDIGSNERDIFNKDIIIKSSLLPHIYEKDYLLHQNEGYLKGSGVQYGGVLQENDDTELRVQQAADTESEMMSVKKI